MIVIREGANTQIDARQVETLARTQFAADNYFTVDIASVDSIYVYFYVTIVDIPRLDAKFYREDFVVKIEGEEIYRGKFTSFISSTLPQGVVISDASIILEEHSDTIKIGYSQPMSPDAEADPRESQVVLEYLESQDLLK